MSNLLRLGRDMGGVMSEMTLFVYGSFTQGLVHFEKLDPYVISRKAAFVHGEVYRLPSGFPVVFPAASQGENWDRVPGEILQLRAPDLIFRLLDEFHGCSPLAPEKGLHTREIVLAQSEEGGLSEATIYVMNRSKLPKGAERVPQGNWRVDMSQRPPLTNYLTERQVAYIRKLSKSSGREIIPIDLPLYRELMKLELIVDKGRRLALSRLGKEVARFLPET